MFGQFIANVFSSAASPLSLGMAQYFVFGAPLSLSIMFMWGGSCINSLVKFIQDNNLESYRDIMIGLTVLSVATYFFSSYGIAEASSYFAFGALASSVVNALALALNSVIALFKEEEPTAAPKPAM